MRTTTSHSDYEPLGRIGRVPVYATTIITALYFIGMVVTAILTSANVDVSRFEFYPAEFYRQYRFWQPFTCTFLNAPDFFFPFGLFFFYMASIEIERYLGRSRLLQLYFLTLVAPALVLGLWYVAGYEYIYTGMYEVTVAMFIAFATLYPNIEYWGWVPMKYIAFVCLSVAALGYFPKHDWMGLSVLLAECVLGFGLVRHIRNGGSLLEFGFLRRLNPFRRRPKFRVLPPPVRDVSARASSLPVSVDAILDKIAQSGFASLTAEERDQLEKAREILLKKGNTRG